MTKQLSPWISYPIVFGFVSLLLAFFYNDMQRPWHQQFFKTFSLNSLSFTPPPDPPKQSGSDFAQSPENPAPNPNSSPSMISRIITYPLEGTWNGNFIYSNHSKERFRITIRKDFGGRGEFVVFNNKNQIEGRCNFDNIQREENRFLIKVEAPFGKVEMEGNIVDPNKISGNVSTISFFGTSLGTFSAHRVN